MKKLLLLMIAGTISAGAYAETKRLESITDLSPYNNEVTNFSYDEEGRLVKADDGYSTYSIDYSALADSKITLTCTDAGYRPTVIVYALTLNEDGLVVMAKETSDNEPEVAYEFAYNDGYLVGYREISDGEIEQTAITLEDGLVTAVKHSENYDRDTSFATFEYDEVMNTGGLTLWDELFGVDLDDLEYLAMAGFMGKPIDQLPVKSTETYTDDGKTYTEVTTMTWTLDTDNYPTGLKIKSGDDSDELSFTWSDANAAITAIEADSNGETLFYTIDGRRASADTKGLIIERNADGTVSKHLNF